MLARSLVVALYLGVIAAPSMAERLQESDRIAIRSLASEMEAALESGDLARVLDFAPPSILQHWAAAGAMTVEEFRLMAAAAVNEVDPSVAPAREITFHFNIALEGETETGRRYTVIPTTTEFVSGEAAGLRANTLTLVLTDADAWWMMAADDQSALEMIFAVYPDLRILTESLSQ